MAGNFEHYKVFYYVAKYENLTKAANALAISQPAVTCCMQNLEHTLGCKLLIRSRKGVTLTPEGEMLYRYAAPACEQLLEGEKKLLERLRDGQEQIRVGATQMAMLSYLVTKLNLFQKKYPQVKIEISNFDTEQTLQELRTGAIDLAIVTTPFAHRERLHVVKVKSFENVLVGGPKYAKLGEQKQHLSQLRDVPLVMLSARTTTYAFYREFYASCRETMSPAVEVASMDMLLPVLLENLGIGFVPEEFARPYLQLREIIPIELYEPIPHRDICLVTDAGRTLSASARRLCTMLESQD